MARRLRLLLLMGISMLLLTSCYKVDADVTFAQDGTVTIKGEVGYPATMPQQNFSAAVKELEDSLPPEADVTKFKRPKFKGRGFEVRNMAPEDIFTEELPFVYRKEGSTYMVSNRPELLNKSIVRKDFPQAPGQPTWTLTLNFPEEISKASEGITYSGRTAEIPAEVALSDKPWTVIAGAVPAEEIVEAAPPTSIPRTPWPSYVFSLLILVGAAIFITGHTRKNWQKKTPQS